MDTPLRKRIEGRRAAVLAGIAVGTYAVGLPVDQYGGIGGQLALSAWTWGAFFLFLRGASPQRRAQYFACLAWSAAGELFLSLVWGLYSYRLGNVPLFVPPGHVLLLYLGLTAAPRLPRWVIGAVTLAAAAYATAAWAGGFDTLSVLLAALFLLCMASRENRPLYAAMFLLSTVAELYGTWVGNWTWHASVPYLGLSSMNPPLAVGAFYCALDVLIVLTVRRTAAFRAERAEAVRRTPRAAASQVVSELN